MVKCCAGAHFPRKIRFFHHVVGLAAPRLLCAESFFAVGEKNGAAFIWQGFCFAAGETGEKKDWRVFRQKYVCSLHFTCLLVVILMEFASNGVAWRAKNDLRPLFERRDVALFKQDT